MPDGAPSITAQRVAAYRLGFERLAAPYGQPDADEALARDVAGKEGQEPNELVVRHLRARTAFFDRVIVNGLDRGVTQVVIVGAGYDGRALRYGKPGVRWWEVDHPDTQIDKTDRLARLGIAHDGLTFVPCRLEVDGLADALVDAGFAPDGRSLFCCEGLVLYLTAASLARVLGDLRSLAAPGTRAALSVSRPKAEPDAARARLDATLAAMGAPVTNRLDGDAIAALYAASRWRPVDLSDKAQRAGMVVLAPEWAPAAAPTSRGYLARFAERMLHRSGVTTLPRHVESTYGVGVRRTRELDLGVHRLDLVDGRSWIARTFPSGRAVEAAEADADLLARLAAVEFPAERIAVDGPVSIHEGQAVLVTDLAAGRPLPAKPESFALLGRLLGRIHTLPAEGRAARRPGGAWHHLVWDGSTTDEVAATRDLLDYARHLVPAGEASRYDALVAAVEALDPCDDLPAALVHADMVHRNAIGSSDGGVTVIDWAGAGRGPRVVSLGCLLWAAGDRRRVRAALSGYQESVTLTSEELDRLAVAAYARPAVLACWTFATGRDSLSGAANSWDQHRRRIDATIPDALAQLR